MQESKMLHTLYAYNAYYYFFNDTNLVNVGALKNLPSSNRTDIYNDRLFGMDNVKKLITWVTATDGPNQKGTH